MTKAGAQTMTAQERILDAVLRAHGVLTDYVEHSPRNCERTIDRLFAILDDQDLIAAVNAINLKSLSQIGSFRGAQSANPESREAERDSGSTR